MPQSIKMTNNVYWDCGSIEIGNNITLNDKIVNLQTGISAAKTVSTTTQVIAQIAFEHEFPEIPTVILSASCSDNSSSGARAQIYVQQVTKTGFRIRYSQMGSIDYTYTAMWIAFCNA